MFSHALGRLLLLAVVAVTAPETAPPALAPGPRLAQTEPADGRVRAGAAEAGSARTAGPEPAITDPAVPAAEEHLLLYFLDVGQGDAVLIREPGGRSVLYDGGDGGTDVVAMLRRKGVDSLDLVIASHNHADHVGGLIDVVLALRPRFYMDNGVPHTTRTYERLLTAVEASGAAYLEPSRRTVGLGDARLLILPPPARPGWDQNDNSVGVVVEYGAFRATLLGDAERRQFEWWLEHHADAFEPVAVHKASHHASRNGDTPESVRRLRPEVVVIGVGAGNPYGHPHPEALALYAEVGAEIFRTDVHGTVRVEAARDGTYRVLTGDPAPPLAAPEQQPCVDINTASRQELERIIHIGPERADQIIQLRARRPFRSVDELTRVRGIGPARLRDIRAQGVACVPGTSSMLLRLSPPPVAYRLGSGDIPPNPADERLREATP